VSGNGLDAASRIAIVGASLAGLRAAEELRLQGYRGTVTIIGDEPFEPYDRPPISKSMLTGDRPISVPYLPRTDELDIDWMLGSAAVELDPVGRTIRLADDREVNFDRALIATGRRARPWADPTETDLDGVVVLRTLEDGATLRDRLLQRPRRVVIIGAGFIGSEVASSCRELGLAVSVIARGSTPLDGALGASVGAWATELYRRAGVDLHSATTVESIEGDDHGRAVGVRLSGGERLTADVVVVATGSEPNVEWLDGSGLDIRGGVAVDGRLRALRNDGTACRDVFAAGDVARWGHPLYRDRLLSIEHWGNALEQGRFAARSMLHDADDAPTFSEIPRFWSTMFGSAVKSVGVPSLADEVVLVQGSPDILRGVYIYGRDGRCVAGVSFDAPRELAAWEAVVVAGESFPPQHAVPDWGGGMPPAPMAARFPERRTTRPQPADGAADAVLESADPAIEPTSALA
jgi:NADPH-dependent 2,4-dienoyl-CoA reductase/sulfur reductase-like enzyme